MMFLLVFTAELFAQISLEEAGLSSTQVYTINGRRGGWYASSTTFMSTKDARTTVNINDANQHFAFVTDPADNSKVYLYSVGQKKFVNKDCTLTTSAPDRIYIFKTGDSYYPLFFTFTADKSNYNINLGGEKQMTVDRWKDYDDGNKNTATVIENTDYSLQDAHNLLNQLGFNAVQGYQTTGMGNNTVMLHATINGMPTTDITIDQISVQLKNGTESRVDKLEMFIGESDTTLFYNLSKPQAIAVAEPAATVKLIPNEAITIAAGKTYNLWINATVKTNATFGETVDAAITELAYTLNGSQTIKPLNIDPDGEAKIFGKQKQLYTQNSYNSRYYRIPAMIVADDGSIITVADKRYADKGDAGSHKIDLVMRRSKDNGINWTEPKIIAEADGIPGSATMSYGDAALAKTKSGKLLCMTCAGSKTFWTGQQTVYMTTSTDNGETWSNPVEITTTERFTDEVSGRKGVGVFSFFVTSGKGLTTKEGRTMFLVDCKRYSSNSPEQSYVLYTDDEGETWTLGKTLVYNNANEGKLVQRKDGSLLASIRQAGKRGFNIGSADGTEWGIQTRNNTLTGSNCNADILVYNDDLMIHSIPVNTNIRKDLRLYASSDEGTTWREVCQIVPGLASYSTMEKLADGSVAVLFEDETNDNNQNVDNIDITFLTIPAEIVSSWSEVEEETNIDVKIADNTTTGPDTYGNSTNKWINEWISSSVSGQAGLKLTSNATFNIGNYNGARCLAVKPSAAGASNDITITAPDGFVITGYEIGAYAHIASETYTLTAENGTSAEINSTTATGSIPSLTVNGIKTNTTVFTLKSKGYTNSDYMLIPWMKVSIERIATGIEHIINNNANANCYNIYGQKIDKNYKGVVICNGKKYINK